MAETVTNELLLEQLKRIQGTLSQQGERLDRVEGELRTIKAHIAGLVQSDLTRETDHASTQARLERIERRLDLVD